MKSRDKIKKVCDLLGLRLCAPYFAEVTVSTPERYGPEYELYVRYRDGVRCLSKLCGQLIESKTLDEANKYIAKRGLGVVAVDGTWMSCSEGVDMFKVTGRSKNVLTNVKTLARKVQKILDQ